MISRSENKDKVNRNPNSTFFKVALQTATMYEQDADSLHVAGRVAIIRTVS